ncbi:hypothetical protein IPM62_06380 [Candidatus Woesebacteria bacterium]|nr:MAG: hypothetical protein IPM62_06380 [Candidatus Woesebacteria bacterium]
MVEVGGPQTPEGKRLAEEYARQIEKEEKAARKAEEAARKAEEAAKRLEREQLEKRGDEWAEEQRGKRTK